MSDAMDLIHKGLDPLVDSNGQEWEGGWNPTYTEDSDDSNYLDEGYNTFDGWLANGRSVKKGEKSQRVKGVPIFTYDQTRPITKMSSRPRTYDEWIVNGRQVKKGERGYTKNGENLFNLNQTAKIR